MNIATIRLGMSAALILLGFVSGHGDSQSQIRPVAFNQPIGKSSIASVTLSSGRELQVRSEGIFVGPAAHMSSADRIGNVLGRRYSTATLMPTGEVLIWGGIDSVGNIEGSAIWIDPASRTARSTHDVALVPRAGHSALLLTDGRLLVIGGWSPALGMVSEGEVWDPRTNHSELTAGQELLPRIAAQLSLQEDGRVEVSAGQDEGGSALTDISLYDPETDLLFAGGVGVSDTNEAPAVAASMPAAGSQNASLLPWISARFSVPLSIDTVTSDTVTLIGPEGPVLGTVTLTDSGRLMFFVPKHELYPGSRYTLFIQGAKSNSGVALPFFGSDFSTLSMSAGTSAPPSSPVGTDGSLDNSGTPAQALPVERVAAGGQTSAVHTGCTTQPSSSGYCRTEGAVKDGSWLPGTANLGGRWLTHGRHPRAPNRQLLDGRAISDRTSVVYGKILAIDDTPIKNVSVSIGTKTALTDAEGIFALIDVPAGRNVLTVDGATANTGTSDEYGGILVSVRVKPHVPTALPQVLYLPRIRDQDKVTISSPTTSETVITHPELPGVEIHIPAGAVIRDRDGHSITHLAIVPMPSDRSPVPLPANFPIYFSVQPAGATVQGLTPESSDGVRIVYPHDKLVPASGYNFWVYDALGSGWSVYSHGHVSEDGNELLADDAVGPTSLMPAGYSVYGPPPPDTAPPDGACGADCDIAANDDKTNDDKDSGGCDCDSGLAGGADTAGDPVDSSSGLFLFHRNDFFISDRIPIRMTRTYRPGNNSIGSFGPGSSMNYNMYLYNPTPNPIDDPIGYAIPQEIDLVLADGSKVPFMLISGNLGFGGPGTWVSTTRGTFNGATLNVDEGDGSSCPLCIITKDGTTYSFDPLNGLLPPAVPSYVQSYVDRFGNNFSLSYSGGNITEVASPGGRYLSFVYNTDNTVESIIDNSDRTVSYAYDDSGRLTGVTYPDNTTEIYTYDDSGNLETVTDRRGHLVLTNQYDSNGRVIQQTLPGNAAYQWSYTTGAGGAVTESQVTDARGFVRDTTYDAAGYPLSITRALGTSIAQTTTFVRGEDEQPTSVTDPLGRTTTYTYDDAGDVLTVTYLAGTPDAVTYSFTYTSDYREVASLSDPLGHTTTMGYDPRGCLTSITDPLNNTTTLTCNSAGQPTTITDALSHTTVLAYSGFDLHSLTDALGRTTTFRMDSLGRRISARDPAGNQFSTAYDVAGRVHESTDSLNREVTFDYDGNGNLIEITTPAGSQEYGYDERNRRTSHTDAAGRIVSWGFDDLDNLILYTDRKGQSTQMQYDALNRLTLATYADGSSITNDFDTANRLTTITDSESGAISRTFDDLDRLTHEESPQGAVDYAYDASSRRTQMTVAGQSAVGYAYDDANRITLIERGNETVGMSYDNANRRVLLTLPNGVSKTYVYDVANQLTGLVYALGATQISAIGYVYDTNGRQTVRIGGFEQAPLPAETSTANVFDSTNRETQAAGQDLTYDDNGSLLFDGLNTYVWDARGRLEQISQSGSVVASFEYDGAGRRVAKTISGETTAFLYDGLNVVQETSAGAVNNLLTGLRTDEIFARDEQSQRHYFLTDAQGSTVALTSTSGSVEETYGYEPYGGVAATGNSNNPYQYTGRENDSTGLYYYRARYYSPTLMRFISQDPMGLAAGLNEYAYAGGDPISLTDRLGLDPFGIPIIGLGGSSQGDAAYQGAASSPAAQIAQAGTPLTWNSPYAPDYITGGLDAYVFSASFTYTRYGDLWTSAGFNRAYPNPVSTGGNLSGGYMMCAGVPTRSDLNDLISGLSGSAGYYDGVGGSILVNPSGTAINIGGGFGGSGVAGSVSTWQGNVLGGPSP